MKHIPFLLLIGLLLTGCGGGRPKVSRSLELTDRGWVVKTDTISEGGHNKTKPISKKEAGKEVVEKNNLILDKVIAHAMDFQGARYKFGGTTRSGVDCSGLVYASFKKESILLPRVSRDMAQKGTTVRLKDIAPGDLVFFDTGNRNRINHVGLVIEVEKDKIWFIHATSSNGVIISGLDEPYWRKALVVVRRVI